LSAELLYLQGVQITQVHVAKQIDFTVTGSPLPLQAAVEGADLVLIASSIDKLSTSDRPVHRHRRTSGKPLAPASLAATSPSACCLPNGA
jgi:hypothetical protein